MPGHLAEERNQCSDLSSHWPGLQGGELDSQNLCQHCGWQGGRWSGVRIVAGREAGGQVGVQQQLLTCQLS